MPTSSFTLVVRSARYNNNGRIYYADRRKCNSSIVIDVLWYCFVHSSGLLYYAVSTSSTIREALSLKKKKVVTTAMGRKVSILAPSNSSSTATTHPQLAPWLGIAPRFILGLLFLVAQYCWIGNKGVADQSAPQIYWGMYNILSTLATIVGTLYYLRITVQESRYFPV